MVNRTDVSGPAAYYEFDGQGNTAQLTGADGTVVNSYNYLPFGETLQATETVQNPFTFVGQAGVMRDGNGLDYMATRWYDPAQGRFTQQDPIRLAGGPNLYAYAANSPVNLIDPTGLGPSQNNILTLPKPPEQAQAENAREQNIARVKAERAAAEEARGEAAALEGRLEDEAWAKEFREAQPEGNTPDYSSSLNPQEGFSLAEVRAEVARSRAAQAEAEGGGLQGGEEVIIFIVAKSWFSIGYGLENLATKGRPASLS